MVWNALELIQSQKLSPLQLFTDHIIPTLTSSSFKEANALIYQLPAPIILDLANKSSERWKNGTQLSVIDGLPVTIKDNIATNFEQYLSKNDRTMNNDKLSNDDTFEGCTTAGSRMLSAYVSPFDAEIVQKLKRSGAIIIGKTNCDEFGMGSYGMNSWFGSEP